jgi:hypothetical protein
LGDRLLDSEERTRISKKELRGIFGPKKERKYRRLENIV